MSYQDKIREALSGSGEASESREVSSERIADRLGQIIWPERPIEVRKESLRQQVRKEAEDDAGGQQSES